MHGSPGNYFAYFRGSASRTGCAIQPIHNEFTNGMLRLEVDIRRPAVWGSQAVETHAARVALIYRKRMADPIWWVGINSTDYPVMFGTRWEGGSNKNLVCQAAIRGIPTTPAGCWSTTSLSPLSPPAPASSCGSGSSVAFRRGIRV